LSWDPYAALGVNRDASDAEIKAAYRKKAKALHPDLHPGDTAKADQFKRASAAFDILGDAEKRKRYDRGEIDADGNEIMGGFGNGSGTGSPFGGSGGFQGDPFEDILGGLFGRGGGGRRRAGPVRGQDVRYRAEVDFLDAVTGASRRFTMADGRNLDVKIPAGLEDGQTLRLKSQGGQSPTGGPPGDALLEVSVKPHPHFERRGADLHMALPISLKQAVEGDRVEVDTPTGRVTVKIPEGSNTGQKLRLKGRGVQLSPTPGHLYARLEIVLKDPKDAKLKALVKEL
jgi:DnaJ-class molecular chaperone